MIPYDPKRLESRSLQGIHLGLKLVMQPAIDRSGNFGSRDNN